MSHDSEIIYGINPVLERFKAAAGGIREVLVSDGADRQSLRALRAEAERLGLTIRAVRPAVLDALAGGRRHQGVIAKVEPYSYLAWDHLLEELSSVTGAQVVLALDCVTDPRNLGALLRTAEAAGVRHVLIPRDRSADVNPVVSKASAGAVHHLRIAKVTNLRRALASLKEAGYWVTGLDIRSGQTIYDCRYPPRLVLVLGSEGKGIRPGVSAECDFKVAIPMLGRVASLNVAVAGAVFLYEVLRQRRRAPLPAEAP